MFTFRTGVNPGLRFITGPGLPKDPKRLIVPAFRTFNTRLRENINLLLNKHSFLLPLFFDKHRTTAFLLFSPTTITYKDIAFRQHQGFTFCTKLHITASGMHPSQ